MAIIRWNPWNMDRIFEEELDIPMFPGISKFMSQGLDIYDTDTEVIVEAALPGIPEDKVDVTMADGIVRISGNVEEEKEKKEKRRYLMSTRSQSFNYTFRLPREVVQDGEPTLCEFGDGILKMVFPKMEKQEPKKITIQKKSSSQTTDQSSLSQGSQQDITQPQS